MYPLVVLEHTEIPLCLQKKAGIKGASNCTRVILISGNPEPVGFKQMPGNCSPGILAYTHPGKASRQVNFLSMAFTIYKTAVSQADVPEPEPVYK